MVDIICNTPYLGAMGDHCKKKHGIAMCVGCGSQIHDQFILRVSPDLEWHAACLKCAECSQYLDETCTCFVRDGKTYCKRDYIRLFGTKCAKCSLTFSKSDFVMRARSRVYHIDCFRCVACSRQLTPGDEFALRDDELFCRADHDVVERASAGGDPLSPVPSSRSLQMAAEPISARQPSLRPHVHKQQEKTTRVRTVLNEKQLHTLRTCYAANPRPDALMKEQLVEMTGLSPRVIRVWFQNKRCKDKKKITLMKQIQQQQQHSEKTSLQGLTGTPMVAGSPIRHDGSVQGNAVEVQSYQPPWKALSEFALQTELEQPAFQQLVTFSESGSLPNSSGSDVTSLSSQLPDTPNSMVPSPVET
ncbi:insulin gene enhancer protein isl-2a isoform X1 [Cetorhinus maximus]